MIMDNEEANTNEQEKTILRIIKRIKRDRNRPCFQNILSFANREENKMEMEELKTIIDKMRAKNIIIETCVNSKEFFSIVDEKFISAGTQTNSDNTSEEITNLESFINASFYNTFVDQIKGEVQNAISDELMVNLNYKFRIKIKIF